VACSMRRDMGVFINPCRSNLTLQESCIFIIIHPLAFGEMPSSKAVLVSNKTLESPQAPRSMDLPPRSVQNATMSRLYGQLEELLSRTSCSASPYGLLQ
jgi:hypothetical protein